jgi:ribosomal protein S18 acetylase RimI-like enzyme
MHIRAFEEKDGEAVIALWQSCSLVAPQNDPQRDIQRKLLAGRELFLVGEEAEVVIASAMGGYDGHRGWLNYLAVCPTKRGSGLGRQMMETLEQLLLAMGCPKLNLQVRDSNSDAIAFYRALGYQVDPVTRLGKRLISD